MTDRSWPTLLKITIPRGLGRMVVAERLRLNFELAHFYGKVPRKIISYHDGTRWDTLVPRPLGPCYGGAF